jgi:hypothetical protein
MHWKRASIRRPEHHEEVLVRCRGMIELAIYDEKKDVFERRNGDVYDLRDDVYWVGVYKEEVHIEPS